MGKNLQKQYPFRTNNDTMMQKLNVIAKSQNRTRNNLIETLLENYLDEYESTNGIVLIDDENEINPLVLAYAQLIVNKRKTLEDVPTDIKIEVEEYLKKDTN